MNESLLACKSASRTIERERYSKDGYRRDSFVGLQVDEATYIQLRCGNDNNNNDIMDTLTSEEEQNRASRNADNKL